MGKCTATMVLRPEHCESQPQLGALTLPSVRHMVVSLKGVPTNLDALPARMRIVAAVNEDLVARSTSSLPPRVVPKRQRVATSDLWYSSLEFVQISSCSD